MPRASRSRRVRAVGIPGWLYVPAGLGVALLVAPLLGLLARVDWVRLPATLSAPATFDALALSVRTSLAATVVCLVLGIPLAVVTARAGPRTARVLRAAVALPLVLPPMVGGVALLYLLGRKGLLGQYLDAVGVRLPFTTAAVVIAQSFVALPFLVISLEGALRTAGTRFELVAASLGASRWTVLRRITVPMVAPGLAAGTVLCLARAMGEFGATALFAGNSPGVTRTMPLAIYSAFNGSGVGADAAVAMSLLLVVVAVLGLLAMRSRPQAEP